MADDTATDQTQDDKTKPLPKGAGGQDFSAFLKSSIGNLETLGKEGIAKGAEAMQPDIKAMRDLVTKSESLMGQIDSIKAPEAPKLKELPKSPDTQYKDPTQALGGIASVIAILGSLKTRAPLTSALNSASASMQAFHQGDKERADLERKKWHDELELGLKSNQAELEQYAAALQKSNFDLNKIHGEFTAIASSYGNHAMLASLESGQADKPYQLAKDLFTAQEKGLELLMRDKERMAQINATAEARRESLSLRRDQMEMNSELKAKKAVEAGKPAERAVEIIEEMKGILEQKVGVTGMQGMVLRPLETVISTLGGDDSAPAHQYESLARELQNILRQTEEFRYKGRTLSKEVADRDVMVRGLKFGDTDGISLNQLNHLENMLTGQGTGFQAPGAPAAAASAKIPAGAPTATNSETGEKTYYDAQAKEWIPIPQTQE